MRASSTSIVPDFMPWALMVANIGTWRCSVPHGRMYCDSVMADMYGLTEAEAHHGVPFSRVRSVIHPDDRVLFDRKNEDVHARGGGIVLEYRIVPRPGVLRWVFVRGRYDLNQPRGAEDTGHGIAIDTTAAREEGNTADEAFYAWLGRRRDDELTALYRASDAAIALRREIDALDEVPGLRAAADTVLRIIARRLAKEVPRDTVD